MADALTEWVASYEGKDRDAATKREISDKARIFGEKFGKLKLGEMKADMLVTWIDGYQTLPGKLASPQTRANLRTKLSQFLNFAKLKSWIENNPLQGLKIERPPRAPVAIFDLTQASRLIAAADKSEHRAIVLPYAVLCLFAGLRPNSEAEQLEWRDIHFATGDIHVRAETSKTREERFVPMEANLIAWLESCAERAPVRTPDDYPYSAALRVNSAFRFVRVSLTGDCTVLSPENPVDGCEVEMRLTATGGDRTVAIDDSIALGQNLGTPPWLIEEGTTTRIVLRYDLARSTWIMQGLAEQY